MIIYEERGINNGGQGGSFTVSLTDTQFSVEGFGAWLNPISISVSIQSLQSVVWIHDFLGYNIAVNFTDKDGMTNYIKFKPRRFERWMKAFVSIGVTPIKNPHS